jgi:Zn-dependent M28 family amino/carboxypeptidase
VYVIALFLVACAAPKQASKTDKQLIENLKAHIAFLADDKLEGRRTGSAGEQQAMEYISNQFKTIGLSPKGTNGYFQPFEVNDGKIMKPQSLFMINGDGLIEEKEYFAFPFSPNVSIDALVSPSLQEVEMPWIIDLKDGLEENANNPHFDLTDYIRNNAKKAKQRGATAIILYNSSAMEDNLKFNGKDRSAILEIPVMYVAKEPATKYFSNKEASLNVKINIDLAEKKRTGHNVLGYLDNGAATTVILGAHFDHLGYGEDGNSMLRTGEKLIHNGADDNASGTAALIELAKKLKASKAKNNNYLFIAFSGEELGLFGSKYFTENSTIDLKTANYMINMDMVGRLNDSTKALTVGGYGTSPKWGEFYSSALLKEKKDFLFKYDSSGTGPSDHTSFYRKDIPVLFYFTGLHTDYHKPTDDAERINYNGTASIITHIQSLIETTNNSPKLAFTKTREAQTTTGRTFSVSLGIMPDYTFSGTGMRADGVTEGKPAQKAGMQAGDIVIQLGEHLITSMDSYMKALGKFKKGDKTIVKFKRGNETLERTVEF